MNKSDRDRLQKLCQTRHDNDVAPCDTGELLALLDALDEAETTIADLNKDKRLLLEELHGAEWKLVEAEKSSPRPEAGA